MDEDPSPSFPKGESDDLVAAKGLDKVDDLKLVDPNAEVDDVGFPKADPVERDDDPNAPGSDFPKDDACPPKGAETVVEEPNGLDADVLPKDEFPKALFDTVTPTSSSLGIKGFMPMLPFS